MEQVRLVPVLCIMALFLSFVAGQEPNQHTLSMLTQLSMYTF